jgi:hypothetical protein
MSKLDPRAGHSLGQQLREDYWRIPAAFGGRLSPIAFKGRLLQ